MNDEKNSSDEESWYDFFFRTDDARRASKNLIRYIQKSGLNTDRNEPKRRQLQHHGSQQPL